MSEIMHWKSRVLFFYCNYILYPAVIIAVSIGLYQSVRARKSDWN